MSEPLAPSVERPISIAVTHINAGDLNAASLCLDALLAHDARHPVALYLAGFVASEQQRWSDAERLLRDALRESPGQTKIVTLLARILCMTGRASDAVVLCRSIQNPMLEITLELARCEEAAGNLGAAEEAYRALLNGAVTSAVALPFAQFLLRMRRAVEAEQILRNALDAPKSINEDIKAELQHQLGLALKLQHRAAEAISVMKAAASCGPVDRASALQHAGLAAQTGQIEDAIRIYEILLERTPLDLEIHALLNDLYCVQRPDYIGRSYDNALASSPGTAALPVAKGRFLLKIGKLEEAEGAFRAALQVSPRHAGALAGLGLVLERTGNRAAAHALHAENIAANPGDSAALEAFGAFLLQESNPRPAVEMLQKAIRTQPHDQSCLAMLGLAYRACQDPREEWLNDYARDAQVFDLEPPRGFPTMETFNAELAAYLGTLHAGAWQYPSQTLRGGTQTYEGLFYQGHRLVDLLLERINAAISVYRSRLMERSGHPFTSRLSRSFRHAGSWSSCLRDQGYHVNHIHPKGWISSCYYVAIPDAVNNRSSREGWLKFGEPPAEFGLDWGPRRFVQPIAGRLVLFPSYMWHGTAPFNSPQERITIAFDTLPA